MVLLLAVGTPARRMMDDGTAGLIVPANSNLDRSGLGRRPGRTLFLLRFSVLLIIFIFFLVFALLLLSACLPSAGVYLVLPAVHVRVLFYSCLVLVCFLLSRRLLLFSAVL